MSVKCRSQCYRSQPVIHNFTYPFFSFSFVSKSLSVTVHKYQHLKTQACSLYSNKHTMHQRPESPTVSLIRHASKYKVHKLHQRYILWYIPWWKMYLWRRTLCTSGGVYVPLAEFMYLTSIRMQVRIVVGDSGLCCCVCVTSYEL